MRNAEHHISHTIGNNDIQHRTNQDEFEIDIRNNQIPNRPIVLNDCVINVTTDSPIPRIQHEFLNNLSYNDNALKMTQEKDEEFEKLNRKLKEREERLKEREERLKEEERRIQEEERRIQEEERELDDKIEELEDLERKAKRYPPRRSHPRNASHSRRYTPYTKRHSVNHKHNRYENRPREYERREGRKERTDIDPYYMNQIFNLPLETKWYE